jgi:hypothetical protein
MQLVFSLNSKLVLLSFALFFSPAHAEAVKSNLKPDEIVQLANGTARVDGEAALARVHAYVFERERRPGARYAFEQYLDIDVDALSLDQRKNYHDRTSLMLIDAERDKQLFLQGESGHAMQLQRTDSEGVTSSSAWLPFTAQAKNSGWITYNVSGPNQRFTGRAQIVPDLGTSIISDIDDTIRDTHVLDTREMLMNTFVRQLKAVPGMAALYQSALRTQGVRIHYLSNAPHALYPLLQQFFTEAGFPEGSVHPRAISASSAGWAKLFKADLLDSHKAKVIKSLVQDFPERSFVLIGDTGEQDPAIYGAIARKYPQRVRMILLRDVTGEARDSPRYIKDLRAIAPAKWQLFQKASALTLADLKLKQASQ